MAKLDFHRPGSSPETAVLLPLKATVAGTMEFFVKAYYVSGASYIAVDNISIA